MGSALKLNFYYSQLLKSLSSFLVFKRKSVGGLQGSYFSFSSVTFPQSLQHFLVWHGHSSCLFISSVLVFEDDSIMHSTELCLRGDLERHT